MIAVGQVLSAMPWGCFQGLTVTYASESNLRLWYYEKLTREFRNSDLGYKLPFALQWIWPAPLMIGIFFAPESPWWLVRRIESLRQENLLSRILSGKGAEDIQIDLTLKQIELY
ncbi:AEL_collapsed_G0006390.mRNA.1.CDS.1 [Saccharomyces cerevisiae]|nr:AEL_collapsed_G0006390.mRNA.1.CDS.1 [Saccharomyces cerevisiae]